MVDKKERRRHSLVLILLVSISVTLACGETTAPTPVPTNAPLPTDTPQPTDTPVPTNAPLPTNTRRPTDTPGPTNTPQPTNTPTPEPTPTPERTEAHVVEVVDGDTIRVDVGGTIYDVRYIGIDTPETVHPSEPVEWMGPEASEANRRLVGGQTVYLEKDVSETDRYGRLLRYVFLFDGTFVNLELVRLGFAQVSTYPPDVRYQDLFLAAQQEARDAGRGFWGPTPPPQPSATSAPTPSPTAAPAPSQNCDPSYPDVCIPPPPPDLDCGDIPYRRFTVLPPDPHGFDGDNDGIGCER